MSTILALGILSGCKEKDVKQRNNILEKIENLGLTNNTLVIFTSDNGPWLAYGNHAGNSGDLREGKIHVFDGGKAVPCIMQMSGSIPQGRTCNELVTAPDILPTIANLTGSALPQNKIDGIDLLDLVLGKTEISPIQLFYHYFSSMRAIRFQNWKLVLPHDYPSYDTIPGKDRFSGSYTVKRMDTALFDLEKDRGEKYNINEYHPDIVNMLDSLAQIGIRELGNEKIISGKNASW